MHIKHKRPVFVPQEHFAELDKFPKSLLMDVVWDLACQRLRAEHDRKLFARTIESYEDNKGNIGILRRMATIGGSGKMTKEISNKCNCNQCRAKRGETYDTWGQEEQEQRVLAALTAGFPTVDFMPANALPQDDLALPDDGRATMPALMRLYKKGLVIRYRTRRGYIWGLPGYTQIEPIHAPIYFDSIEARRDAGKPQ